MINLAISDKDTTIIFLYGWDLFGFMSILFLSIRHVWLMDRVHVVIISNYVRVVIMLDCVYLLRHALIMDHVHVYKTRNGPV